MKKNYLISYIYLISIIFILLIIVTLTSYFINYNPYLLKIIIPIISMLISSIILGKKCTNKAYLEGIKFSLFYIILIIIINLLTIKSFTLNTFIIYFLLIFSSVIGSMIGINITKK